MSVGSALVCCLLSLCQHVWLHLVDKGCKTTLSVARHQKSNDSKKVGYYHWAVCAKCHAWTKAGSKQITMRDGFQYPFQSKKKGGKDKIALVDTAS